MVHELNKRKGFYDYEKDVVAAEEVIKAMDDSSSQAGAFAYGDTDCLKRILIDYKRAMHERKLLLVIGELCEAHEEMRAGHAPAEIYFSGDKQDKPEGVPIELADAQIRLWDLEQAMKIDGEYCATLKHEYNEGRKYRHGKQF